MKQQDVLKSIGLHTEARSLIQTTDDSTAKIIEKGLREDQSGRVGRPGNAWDNLQGQLTENHAVSKSLAGLGVMKGYGDENLKNNHSEQFHTDNDKEVEKMVTTIDEVDSVHGIDEQENSKVREGKKKRSGDYQLDNPNRETKRKEPVGAIKRSLSQDELFAKAMGELVPEPKAKKGALVDWAKEEEKEQAHAKKSLFNEPSMKMEISEYVPTKADLLSQFAWKMRELKELKESSWFMERELDESARGMAEKLWSKLKKEIEDLVEKYGRAKKSFGGDLDDMVNDVRKAYMGFDALAAKTSPAIAAKVGREKYGKKKFQDAAASGKKLGKSESALDDIVGIIKGDSLVEMVEDQNDPDVIANIHENSVSLAPAHAPTEGVAKGRKSNVPFLKSAGPGGFVFDFGNLTGNPLADNATALLNRHADGTQAAIAQDQRQSYDRALTQFVQKGEAKFAGGEFGAVNNEWADQMNKPLDQQVREAHEAGQFEKSTGPAVKNEFNKVEATVGNQVVKATSPTDAAVLEMFKAEQAMMNEPGMVVADARNGGRQSVVVDAATGAIE